MGSPFLLGRIHAPGRMAVDPVRDAASRVWSLTQPAFDGLLASLGPDRDVAADRYLEIRRNLVASSSGEAARHPRNTLTRPSTAARGRSATERFIRDVPTYCIGIARMLLLEDGRDRAMQARPLDEAPEPHGRATRARRRSRSARGMPPLVPGPTPPDHRTLILSYYQGRQRATRSRTATADPNTGNSAGTLRMRALRVRASLQLCAENCVQKQGAMLP
jgi:hypothetical protein